MRIFAMMIILLFIILTMFLIIVKLIKSIGKDFKGED